MIGKTFRAVPAADDTTVAEAFLEDGRLHDFVVAVGVDTDAVV